MLDLQSGGKYTKKRAKLTLKYFEGGKKDSDLVRITALSNECTKAILEAKLVIWVKK